MKYKVILLAFISAVVMSFSFVDKGDFRPPGTTAIVDNFFFDVGEIRNADWREYLSYIEVNDGIESEAYKNAVPNNEVWQKEGYSLEPYKEEYFSNAAYDIYPVVGVSHKQASTYCQWRTKAVKRMIEANKIKVEVDFAYRLPSRTEWEMVANAGFDAKAEKVIAKKRKENGNKPLNKQAIYHMKSNSMTNVDNKFEFHNMSPAPSTSYLPNKYGVYHIYGNVAEMIQEPGVAMGGSFEDFYEDIVPLNNSIQYDGPKYWLGFRCVCEVSK